MPTSNCRTCANAVLVREVTHRAANLLQEAVAAIHLAARGDRRHLEEAARRLNAGVALHKALIAPPPKHGDLTRSLELVGRSCLDGTAVADIALHVDGAPLAADPAAARILHLLAAEAISNAARHAFAGGPGSIWIKLCDDRSRTVMTIHDDGHCHGWVRNGGQGTGIIDDLAGLLGGEVARTILPSGALKLIVSMPSIVVDGSELAEDR